MTDTPPTDAPKLLPCPFCGGKAQISRAHQNKMLAMGEVATDEHYLFTLHHTCNPALNDGVTVCWTYKPKAVLVAAWNRRTPTPPTDDEREGLARAIAPLVYATVTGNDDCREWEEMPEYVQDIYFQAADAALAYLAPIRAREIAAAEARGLERAREVVADCRNSAASEPARSDDWQDGVLTGMDTVGFAIFAEINAIERGEHDTGKEG